MNPENFVIILEAWNNLIDRKVNVLSKSARIHKVLGITSILTLSFCLTVIGFLSTFGLSTSCEKNENIVINSIILFFTVISALIEAFNTTVNPMKTAKDCSTTSKQYRELYKEIQVEILSMDDIVNKTPNDLEYRDEDNAVQAASLYYKQKLLYYSTKEQLILIEEPLLIYTHKYRGSILETPRKMSLDTKINNLGHKLRRASAFFRNQTESDIGSSGVMLENDLPLTYQEIQETIDNLRNKLK